MSQQFKNKVAVVTGGGSGIGRAIALEIARRGARVCLLGRDAAKLEAVAAEIAEMGGKSSCYPVDLADQPALLACVQCLTNEWPAVDILVHSAGVIRIGAVQSAAVEDFDWHYRVNVRAPFLLTQTLLAGLRAVSGDIVFINSTAGLSAAANVSQYAATKYALRALADSLRHEVNSDGVRVLSVYPGRTASAMQQQLCAEEGRQYRATDFAQPQDIASVVINALELPRTAELTDLQIRPLHKSG